MLSRRFYRCNFISGASYFSGCRVGFEYKEMLNSIMSATENLALLFIFQSLKKIHYLFTGLVHYPQATPAALAFACDSVAIALDDLPSPRN